MCNKTKETEPNFNHDADEIWEAIGTSKERMENTWMKTGILFNKSNSCSEFIEALYNSDLNRLELCISVEQAVLRMVDPDDGQDEWLTI